MTFPPTGLFRPLLRAVVGQDPAEIMNRRGVE